ncbi:hypothetical protein QAD02_011810, partial [Eretmocerus hayati]
SCRLKLTEIGPSDQTLPQVDPAWDFLWIPAVDPIFRRQTSRHGRFSCLGERVIVTECRVGGEPGIDGQGAASGDLQRKKNNHVTRQRRYRTRFEWPRQNRGKDGTGLTINRNFATRASDRQENC